MAEKRKLKRFASVFLASSLIVGALAACSSNEQGTSSTGNSSEENSDVIKIGANLELSGSVASYGSSIGQGAELAVEEINEAGGIDGKKIELVKVDNKSDNAEATNAAVKLATQEKVVAMIAPATSGNVIATTQIANKYKIPTVTASGTAPNVTENEDGSINEFVFRTCFIDPFKESLQRISQRKN